MNTNYEIDNEQSMPYSISAAEMDVLHKMFVRCGYDLPANLGNCTAPQQYAPMEGANMAKSRIRRRVEIGGKCVWITAMNEQEYALNVLKAMSSRAEPTKRHPFKEYATMWFETYSRPNVEATTAVTYARQLELHLFPILGCMC